MEAAGEIVLRQSGNGITNYIALAEKHDPESTSGGEVSNAELQELFATMSTEYYQMAGNLARAEGEAKDNFDLAAEYEGKVKEAEGQRDVARAETEEVKTQLGEFQRTAGFEATRGILARQETELGEMRAAKLAAELSAAERTAEVERLSGENARLTALMEAEKTKQQRLAEGLQKKLTDTRAELKKARKQHGDEVADLRRQIAVFEKGDGLTAAKAAAAAMFGVDLALEQARTDILESLITTCQKYLPEDKRDAFRADASAAYRKIDKRANSRF
jgi:hypothetical protein